MTLLGRGERYERVEHFGMLFRISPISRDAGPLGAQNFLIRVGILDDKRSKPIRMRRDYAKADRPAVVMKVEGVFVDLELLEKSVDRLGKTIESVRIRRRWRVVTNRENPALSGDSLWPARG